ncbi:hypothetical protein EMIT0P258_90100 [Pseudomonas sp. IT-P258]
MRPKRKKTCTSSGRLHLDQARPSRYKPIVEQFCHLPFTALSSGLDSLSQGETGRSQNGKIVETFSNPDRSSDKKVRCDWCNLCNG